MEEIWTAKEIAEKLKVKPSTIYAWRRDGFIPYVRLKGSIRFRENVIARWLRERDYEGRKTRQIKV